MTATFQVAFLRWVKASEASPSGSRAMPGGIEMDLYAQVMSFLNGEALIMLLKSADHQQNHL